MSSYTIANGTTISIDGDVATASKMGITLYLGNPQGLRETETDMNALEGFGTDYRTMRHIHANARLDESTKAWLDANWPVKLRARWDATTPAGVKAWRAYSIVMHDYHLKMDRRLSDENLSYCMPPRPKIEQPKLTPEEQAWMSLDSMLDSSIPEKRIESERAIRAHLDNGLGIIEAAQQAEAGYKERMSWD